MSLEFFETRREKAFDSFLKVDRIYVKQRTTEGEWSEEFSREVMLRRNAVAILLIDPVTKKLLFTRQLRMGSSTQGEPWIYEMVAGLIDPGEDEITALKREAQEEAGIDNVENIKLISEYYSSAGVCSEKISLYYGEADLSNVSKSGGNKAENEYIEILLIDLEDAFVWQEEGKFGTANGNVALYWLMKERLLGRI